MVAGSQEEKCGVCDLRFQETGMDWQFPRRLPPGGGFPPQISGSLSLSFLCFSSALTINANKTEVEMIALNE